MAIRVLNAHRDLSFAELAPYFPQIDRLLGKLVARFPDDQTATFLTIEFMSGQKVLWLILDGDELIAVAMTSLQTMLATGKRIAALRDLAGEGIDRWAEPLCAALEAWGDENGVDFYSVEGRNGWGRVIERMGYRIHAVLWRKPARAA